jgi:hypothetical protein
VKRYVTLFLMLLNLSAAFAQLNTFYVTPISTNAGYVAAQDSHLVALNPAVTSNNLLLVFIDGSGSKTKDYTFFPKLAASLGYHVVSVAYPNSPTIGSVCAASADSMCYDNYRQEVCYGTPVSSSIAVDSLNSIHNRLVNLLTYLSTTYPSDGWGQFVTTNDVNWSSVVTSGHSQGSGHALYFAKTKAIHRVIMFAGVDDYSVRFNKPPHWVYSPSVTPPQNIYSFLHLQDDVEPYPHEYESLKAIGLVNGVDDSTIVDNKTTPYNNSHCLYTNVTPPHAGIASAYHDAPVVDYFTSVNGTQLLYNPVWTYMLTTAQTTGIAEALTNAEELTVYPNPASSEISWSLPSLLPADVEVFSLQGASVEKVKGQTHMDISALPAGVYLLTISQGNGVFHSRLIKN